MTATMLGKGLYTFPEAASLVGLKAQRVREWFQGRPDDSSRRPVFFGDFEPVDGDSAISFLDLVDVFVAGQLREHGVSLQTVRRVYTTLQQLLCEKHAFGRQELLTDGKIILKRGLDETGEDEIVEVLTRQKVFPTIILPFLKSIDYGQATRLAARWHIANGILVDPELNFGKPIVDEVGIATHVLAESYEANSRDVDSVADWFNVLPKHVIAAVKFETGLSA